MIGFTVLVFKRLDMTSRGVRTISMEIPAEEKQEGSRWDLEVLDNSDLTVKEDTPKARMDARKRHLQKACAKLTLDADVADQRDLEITIAYGKLKLCGLEKTASTFMKAIRAKEKGLQKEQPFKSFIIVREPYGRLLSGYIDKLFSRATWWDMYGKYIVEHFRYRPKKKEVNCGSNVTFHEFIKYWFNAYETGNKEDGHFRPMHKTCRMCYFDYDYYVRLETIGSDMTYIYQQINMTLDRQMSDDEMTIKDKAADIINQRDKGGWQGCESACSMLKRTWWSFHARGLVAMDVEMPVKEEECETISRHDFVKLAHQSHLESKARIDKPKQRWKSMVDYYLQIPLVDRLKIRDILMKDFKLHGYDPTPRDMFPELH